MKTFNFEKDGEYRFRFFGKIQTVLYHTFKKDIITSQKYKETDYVWKLGYIPIERYYLYALDRSDNLIKLIELNKTILRFLKSYRKTFNISPMDKDFGCDIFIYIEPVNSSAGYCLVSDNVKSPLSEKEKIFIDKNCILLSEVFKPMSVEEIKESFLQSNNTSKCKLDQVIFDKLVREKLMQEKIYKNENSSS